ncbi:PREDICTED: peptidyl-prolyl cis-trans isomerase CYP59-like [Populus euphratica]|uniref:Peptidyl-prolyl cis-trans isomerase CYP59-like n=1 Tax=Populus euphratica TaxID=75702 RepID=A0AAJ6TI11_POPEU|nr:PREDICTED: peptidyl-prolyl cis-trans isomerase CYP59-like [Populus euphratica]
MQCLTSLKQPNTLSRNSAKYKLLCLYSIILTAGRRCFKCGSPDHMAKDCNGDPANKHHPLKNILKDDDMQYGGDNNSRYEMVFDGDTPESPRPEKRGTCRDTEIVDMERTNDVLKVKEVNIMRSDFIEKSLWTEENEEIEEETTEITEREIQIVKEGCDDHKDDQDYRKRSSNSHRDHDSHKGKRDERDHRHRSA